MNIGILLDTQYIEIYTSFDISFVYLPDHYMISRTPKPKSTTPFLDMLQEPSVEDEHLKVNVCNIISINSWHSKVKLATAE